MAVGIVKAKDRQVIFKQNERTVVLDHPEPQYFGVKGFEETDIPDKDNGVDEFEVHFNTVSLKPPLGM